jgi:hypothetical protein
MVTIYTERGRVTEDGVIDSEVRQSKIMRLGAVCLGTGLLLSLVGAFNLNADVNDLTHNKVPYMQDRISQVNPVGLHHLLFTR